MYVNKHASDLHVNCGPAIVCTFLLCRSLTSCVCVYVSHLLSLTVTSLWRSWIIIPHARCRISSMRMTYHPGEDAFTCSYYMQTVWTGTGGSVVTHPKHVLTIIIDARTGPAHIHVSVVCVCVCVCVRLNVQHLLPASVSCRVVSHTARAAGSVESCHCNMPPNV